MIYFTFKRNLLLMQIYYFYAKVKETNIFVHLNYNSNYINVHLIEK